MSNKESFDEDQPLLKKSDQKKILYTEMNKPIFKTQEIYSPLLNKNGSVNIVKVSVAKLKSNLFKYDPFHSLINTHWWILTLTISVAHLFVWFIFGIGYFGCILADPQGCISNAYLTNDKEQSNFELFSVAFFFSVQSQQTIGFGYMSPTNYVSCILVALQAIVGLLMEACSIGLVYAKFSRATTRASSIMFSKNAIIGNRDDKKSFFFRFSDIRKHQLLEPHIRIYFATNKCTKEGEDFLNFQQMKITVGDSFIVFLSGYPTTVVHEIDEESPIYNVEDFKLGEIIVILEGIDSTTASTIHSL